MAITADVGVSAREASVAELTVRIEVPEIPSREAVSVADPVATAVAIPCVPAALLMVATAASSLVHVTELVTSWVELSE